MRIFKCPLKIPNCCELYSFRIICFTGRNQRSWGTERPGQFIRQLIRIICGILGVNYCFIIICFNCLIVLIIWGFILSIRFMFFYSNHSESATIFINCFSYFNYFVLLVIFELCYSRYSLYVLIIYIPFFTFVFELRIKLAVIPSWDGRHFLWSFLNFAPC